MTLVKLTLCCAEEKTLPSSSPMLKKKSNSSARLFLQAVWVSKPCVSRWDDDGIVNVIVLSWNWNSDLVQDCHLWQKQDLHTDAPFPLRFLLQVTFLE